MTDPILHPASSTLLKTFITHMPQSFLLTGPHGVGLATIAIWIAGKSVAGTIRPHNNKGEIDPQGTISVDMIRDLYGRTRSKQGSTQTYIIDDADRMSAGAQAAFLKLLEEPTQHTHFLLTSHYPQKLLPTITSRTQHAQILPITAQQTTEFLQARGIIDPTKQAQLHFIAGGLPAQINRLIDDESMFLARAKIVTDARTLLQADPYTKLLVIQRYQTNRADALLLIDGALTILRRTMSAKPDTAVTTQLRTLLDVYEKIAAQHNIRLQLARFVI